MLRTQEVSPPLFADPSIVELLNILKGAKMETALAELTEIISFTHVAEKQLNAVASELQSVKRQLNTIQDKKNPVKTAFNTMVERLESRIDETRTQLDALKQSITDSAKTTVAAFKAHGIEALKKVLDVVLLSMKKELNFTKNAMHQHIKFADQSISRIDAIAGEIHEVSVHTQNIGRAARGKELAKRSENGKLTKIAQAPFYAFKNFCSGKERRINTIINKIEQREQKRETEKKPSLLKTLETKKAIAAAHKPFSMNNSRKQEASL